MPKKPSCSRCIDESTTYVLQKPFCRACADDWWKFRDEVVRTAFAKFTGSKSS